MWDLIVSVPDHCLSFYFTNKRMNRRTEWRKLYTNREGVRKQKYINAYQRHQAEEQAYNKRRPDSIWAPSSEFVSSSIPS